MRRLSRGTKSHLLFYLGHSSFSGVVIPGTPRTTIKPKEVIVMLITIVTGPRRDIPPLRRLRYERWLSIKEFSEITGLSPNTIYRLETGGRTAPSNETLKTLAEFYGLTLEEISKIVPPVPTPRKAIKELRDAKRISGRELAKLSGISYRTFLRAQRGEPVRTEVIVSIAEVLKVAPHVIAPDVFTPPLDPRSIVPPRMVTEEDACGTKLQGGGGMMR
jgi:transcriptional regulator with XRE-family HTH domain